MEKLEKEIQNHKDKLKELTNNLENNTDEELVSIMNNDIKNEINFIKSLTGIKKSLS